MKLDNPCIRPWQYAKGSMHGFNTVKEALDVIQGNVCLLCGKPIEHKHHIVPKSKGGMDTLENYAGLCEECHEAVHKDSDTADVLKGKKSGSVKKYSGASVLNQIIPQLLQELEDLFPGRVAVTDGYTTKKFREQHGIGKTHASDAYCIGCATLKNQAVYDAPNMCYTIKQYRRHDRAVIKAQLPRVYKLDGKKIAVNRHKGFEQKEDSLEDWYDFMVQQYGKEQADTIRSRLTVTKSTRRYNSPNRVMPGAVFLYKGHRHVLKGQLTGGQYYRAEDAGNTNFPAKDCNIVYRNTGLVFI